jgi:hypothetical protein
MLDDRHESAGVRSVDLELDSDARSESADIAGARLDDLDAGRALGGGVLVVMGALFSTSIGSEQDAVGE